MSKLRDVSPFLKKLRNFLSGRSFKHPLRTKKGILSPPLPPPEALDEEPNQQIFKNYYYMRDPRNTCTPTEDFLPQTLIEGSEETKVPKPVTPGQVRKD